MIYILLLTALTLSHALPQSNYADQANNIEYIGEGLPPEATLGGKVTQLDDLSPEINLNKTRADLNCAAGSMMIDLKFKEAFYGIVYADFDRNSACQVAGKGALKYQLELPLKGCGTKQIRPSARLNNWTPGTCRRQSLKFRHSLKLLVIHCIAFPQCNYHIDTFPFYPLGTKINFFNIPIQRKEEPKLTKFRVEDPQRVFTNNIVVRFHPGLEMDGDEIITIVCRYPPPIVQEPPILTPLEIVAPREAPVPLSPLPVLLIICGILFLSLFLLGLAASYMCLRRRPFTVIRTMTPSESDIEKLSESSLTMQPLHESSGSEYPGESPSEIEEHAAVHENASFSSDAYDYAQEQQVEQVTAMPSTIPRLPIAIKEDTPKFNVQVKMKRPAPPTPPSSYSPIEEEILEMEEPVHMMAAPMPTVHHPDISQHFVDDVYLRTIKEKKIIEDIDRHKRQVTEYHTVPKPEPPQIWDVKVQNIPVQAHPPQWEDFSDISSASGLLTPKMERHMSLPPQPQIDDNKLPLSAPELVGNLAQSPTGPPPLRTFVRSPTGSPPHRTFMTTDLTTRQTESFVQSPKGPPPQRIFVQSPTGPSPQRTFVQSPTGPPPQRTFVTTDLTTRQTETTKETTDREEWLKVFNVPRENPEVPNWDVLLRVLQPEPEVSHVIETAETFNSQLTMTDRMKWRQIITTESVLRTLLTEAVVREDFERISHSVQYRHVFEPPKWDVIIRILTPEDIGPDQKYFQYPRRGSLPTLLEYDSDDASSIREPHLYPSSIFRRSMHRSEADLRSMTEMTVEFGRSYHAPSSGPSHVTPDSPRMYLNRSLSQPSLGRSISEFTERDRWLVPDTPSEFTTPEQTPRLQRSPKIKAFHLPRIRLDSDSSSRGQAESSWQATESSRVAQTPGGTTTQERTREVRGATRARWGKPAQPGPKGWFPSDSGSENSFK